MATLVLEMRFVWPCAYRTYGTSPSIGKNVLRADVKLTLVEKWSLRGVIAELRIALGVWR
jgi:hypothetical protein